MTTEIDTSKKNWQKQMAEKMKKKEEFVLLTSSEELAKDLESGKIKNRTLKLIFLGGGAAAAGGIAGLSGTAGAAVTFGLAAAADPELVSKVTLAIIAGVCTVICGGFIVLIVKMLKDKNYAFEVEYKAGKWYCKATPQPA